MSKEQEEFNKDWIEVVKLSWAFPGVYDMTLNSLRNRAALNNWELPKVDNPLEYIRDSSLEFPRDT